MADSLHYMQRVVKTDVAHRAFVTASRTLHYVHMQLANIRKQQNLSLKDLGEMVGLDASTIQRAETMHHSAKLATYKLCASALGVDLTDLFSDDRTAQELAILRVFRQARPEQRERMVQMLELATGLQTPEAK